MNDTMENGVVFVLPDGFAPEDLRQTAYAEAMDTVCAQMTEENEYLSRRAGEGDFDPVRELDYTNNGCGLTIDRFFEMGAKYEEGRVPPGGFEGLLASFRRLMEVLGKGKCPPLIELDAVGVAFREALLPFRKRCDRPDKPRRVYLKAVFRGRDVFKGRLRLLHEAYVKAGLKTCVESVRRKKRKAAVGRKLTPNEMAKRNDRKRVLVEIARLCRLGMSAPKAIRHMRAIGTWTTRMRGVKDATWLRYHRAHCREGIFG